MSHILAIGIFRFALVNSKGKFYRSRSITFQLQIYLIRRMIWQHCYWQQIGSCIWPFHWHIYIWSWFILQVRFKVMHISTVNISQKVTDRTNIAIANIESHMSRVLSIGIFKFDLGSFWRSESRSCTFHMLISQKRWPIEQTLILPTNKNFHKVFHWYIYIWQ